MLGVEGSKATTVYVDDLLIASESLEEYCKKLEIIFCHFKVFGVTIK